MSSELLIITRLQDSASAGLRALRDEIEGIEGSTGIAGRGFAGLQSVGTVALAAIATAVAAAATAVVAFLASSISYGIEFESAFAGIVKTVDGVADSFGNLTPVGEQLRDEIRQLALTIPVAATELARIGELAGQMGIQADGIIYFTDTIAKLGVTTNLSSDQAAMAIARLMNVMGTSNAQVSNLGSAIVWLGNNFAATESEIVDFASRLAGVGALVGLTEADILGIGAAFSAAGVQAEAGGTAVQKVLMTIQTAVMEGGSKLELFAQTAGMTADEFAAAWRDDAGNAFVTFVEGLGAAGEDGIAILNELGLMDQRLIRSFLAVAAAGDLLRTAVEGANFAFADNTALAREAAIRFQTVENQMVLFKNVIRDVQIGLYDALRPAIVAVIAQMTIIASTVGPQLVSVMTVIAATIGEFIRNLQAGMPVMDALAAALEGIVPEPLIAALTALGDAIIPVVQAIVSSITSFVTWKDVLIGVGIAIASVLLPMLYGIIGGILSLVAPLAAVIVAVAVLRNAWEADFLGIRTAVEGAVETFGRFVEAIRVLTDENARVQAMADVLAALPGPLQALALGVSTFLNALRDGEGLVAAFQAGLETLKQAIFTWAGAEDWSGVGQAILDKIASAFTNLGDRAATTAAGILNWISTAVNSIDWVAVGTAIVNGIAAAIAAVVGLLVTAGTAIAGFITGFFTNESLATAGTNIVAAIGNAISGAAAGIATGLDSIRQAIFDWAGADSWLEVGQTIIGKIADAFLNLGDKVAEVQAGIFNWIADAINGIDWHTVGESIINGIVAAITAVVGLLVTAGTAIVNYFVGFFTNEEVGPAGQNLITSLGNAIGEFASGINDGLARVRDAIFDWAGVEDWSGVAQKIAEMIGEKLGEMGEAISGQLTEWQTAIFDWAGVEDWSGVAQHIAELIGEKLGEFGTAVAEKLGEWQQAIFDWAGEEDWQGVAEHIAELIGEKLGEVAASVAEKLGEWQQAIFDWAGEEDWQGVADHIAELIGVALGEAKESLAANLSEWRQAIFDWADTEDWQGVADHIAELVAAALTDSADQVTPDAGSWPQALQDWAGTEDWAEVSAKMAELIGDGLADEVEKVTEKMSGWVGEFTAWVERTDFKQVGYDIMYKITDAFLDFKTTVETKIATWLTDLQTATAGYTWYEIGAYILMKIVEALTGKGGEGGGEGANWDAAVGYWIYEIGQAITRVRASLEQLGRDIVDGVAAGITAAVDLVTGAFGGVIARILQEGEQEAGAQSPARAFMPLGSDITAGVAVGITQNVGAVISAIQQVAQAIELEGVKAFGEAMQAIAAGVAAALSAILDIGSFQGAGDGFGAAMQALVDMMAAMVSAVVSANTYTAEVLENLGTFVEAAEAINDLLVQTAGVVDYIGRWRAPDIAAANGSIEILVGFLAQMVQGIISLNLEAMLILGELGNFLDSAAELPALFMGVADIASYLAGWQAPSLEPVIANVQQLAALLGVLVTAVAGANTMGLGMLEILAAFTETALGVVALIAPLADAMFDIANFPPGAEFSIMQRNIETMAGYLAQIVTAVAGANTMGLLSLEQLSAFVEVAADIVALIDPMAQAMFGIANFPQGTDVQVMAHNIETMAGYLHQLVAAIAESNTWGQLSLELLDTFVQVAGSIAELITPLAEAIWNIANFQPPDLFAFVGNIATLAGHLGTMVVWFYSSLNLSQAALEALGQYIDVMSSIAEGIVSFTDAIAAIAAFEPPDLFTFVGNIATLAGHLGTMVVWFYNGLNLSQAALEALGQYIEVMSSIAEGMVSFIDAIAAIANFEPPDLFTFIGNVATLAGHLATMVVWFYNGLNLSMAALEALGQYVEVIGDLVDLIADAIEALGLIAAYSGNTAVLGPAIAAFAADLLLLVQTLATAFASASAAALAAILAAGEFADAVGDILGLVEDGVEALVALASYVPAANLVPTAQQFAADLAMVITTVVAALQQAGILASTAIVAAGELADGLADVLGMVEDGVSALVELSNYVPNAGLVALAQRFAVDLAAVITAVVNALVQAGLLANEAVVRAGELADGLADILSVVADGVEAITALTAYVAASGIQEKAAAFAADLATVINAIVNGLVAAGLLASQAVVAAGELAGRLGDLLGVVAAGIEAIQALAEYQGAEGLQEKVRTFTTDLIAVATLLATQLTLAANTIGVATIDAARSFATAVTALASEVQAAMTALGQLGGMATPKIDAILAYIVTSAQQIQTAFATAGDIGSAVQYAEMFRANLQQLVAEVQQAVTLLSQIAGSGTSGSVQGALSAIATALQNTEGQFAGAGTALANALISALTAGVAGGQGAATGALLALLSVTRSAGEGAGGSFSTVGSAIISAIVGAIQSGQAQVIAAVVAVVNAAVAAGVAAARAADAIGQQVIQAALAELNSGRGQLDSAGVATGTAIIDGMSRAIVAGKSRVVSAILETIRAAIAAAQSALGIASPSKVATRLFRNFMETASRTVDAFSGSLADSVRSAVSGATAAAAAGLPRSGLPLAPAAAIPMPPGNARLSEGLAESISRARGRGPGGVSTGSTQVVLYGNVVLPGVTDTRSFLEELDALRGGV